MSDGVLGRMAPVILAGSIALALVLVAVQADPNAFDRFFAGIPPAIVVVGTLVPGVLALAHLERRGWNPGADPDGWWIVMGAAIALGAIAIAADVVLRFAEDINIDWPVAAAAYPVIALVVELLLHVLPLAVLLAAFGPTESTSDARFWVYAAAIALIEAAIQVGFAGSTGTAVFSGLHLMAIGIFQIYLFRRFGFLSMLGFRLAYYTIWHIAWGAVRLRILF